MWSTMKQGQVIYLVSQGLSEQSTEVMICSVTPVHMFLVKLYKEELKGKNLPIINPPFVC